MSTEDSKSTSGREIQPFRYDVPFSGQPPATRKRRGHMGLDVIQALVPAAAFTPALINHVAWWVFYPLYFVSFLVAAISYFGNVRSAPNLGDKPLWGLLKSFCLGFGAIIVGQLAQIVPPTGVVICAVALVGMMFANARVVRALDSYIPELASQATSQAQKHEGLTE